MYFTYLFSTNGRVFQKFLQKVLARDLKIPIMHRTQRRTVVKHLSFQVRRCFLLFNNVSDNLCG
ncbi:hypothetical protein, partial [Haemophilus aegyptius]|uniref:hypothetical protein n=1 Tax=Haemophilus aegyptius TaxID=197575 RepID=UPI001C5279A5